MNRSLLPLQKKLSNINNSLQHLNYILQTNFNHQLSTISILQPIYKPHKVDSIILIYPQLTNSNVNNVMGFTVNIVNRQFHQFTDLGILMTSIQK